MFKFEFFISNLTADVGFRPCNCDKANFPKN